VRPAEGRERAVVRALVGGAVAAAVAILGACGHSTTPTGGSALDAVPIGTWGDDHAGLMVGEVAASAEFDCAHGQINGAMTLDAMSRFDVSGTYTQEGGPVANPPPPADVHPARYTGSTDGHTLILNVTLTDTGEALGPYTLTFGNPPRLVKCL
jgi:hypothetical protein